MKIKRSCKISLTLLGLSTLFLSGCDNGPSLEQKQAWLLEQETKAADSLTPQDKEAAEWEYNNWTPEEKAAREQESRQRGYRDDPRLPWWVYWMIFNALMSPYNMYTGFRPSYYYSPSFQTYQRRFTSGSSDGFVSKGSGSFDGRGSAVTRGGFGSRASGRGASS
jgi:uncharacterized membrane protein YgcG